MNRERRKVIIDRTRYFAATLIENIEPMRSNEFNDLSDDEQLLVEEEMKRIGKRIYKETQA
ncbi:hypothetical protein RYA05_04285 [Pseudomonas syringae pv. actinidiae]|nr:hypothetical protein [Pseudomonas syringae pv. actinidiae]